MRSTLPLSNFPNPQRIWTTMKKVTILLVLVCAVAILAHPSDDAYREGEHNELDCGCQHENHQEHSSEERSVYKREVDFAEHD